MPLRYLISLWYYIYVFCTVEEHVVHILRIVQGYVTIYLFFKYLTEQGNVLNIIIMYSQRTSTICITYIYIIYIYPLETRPNCQTEWNYWQIREERDIQPDYDFDYDYDFVCKN